MKSSQSVKHEKKKAKIQPSWLNKFDQERIHCMAEITPLVELKNFHEWEGDFLMFSTGKTNKRVVAWE